MIGVDFPIRPEWVHDVHMLWQPGQPVSDLVQLALDRTMQELGGEKTRRNSLSIILRYFVATKGRGQSRYTMPEDVWVAYSRAYPVSTMAPAYLSHFVAQSDVAQAACEFVTRRYSIGDTIESTDLRHHAVRLYGQRRVVTNAASAFLRSLEGFSVCSAGEQRGMFVWDRRLPVLREVFPLIVWAWWQAHLSPQIDLDQFEEDPALAFLEHDAFAAHWHAYQPALWVLEERLGTRRATLRQTEEAAFERALIDMVRGLGEA